MTKKSIKDLNLIFPDVPPAREISDVVAENQAWNDDRLVRPEEIPGLDGSRVCAFNVISLPAWLAVARAAGVPVIEAVEIASFPTQDYLRAMDGTPGPGLEPFNTFVSAWVASNPGHLLRMEQVSPHDIKYDLSAGRKPGEGMIESPDGKRFVDLFDSRFYDTLLDLGEDQIRCFARRYVEPVTRKGDFRGAEGVWPVEFRVFVENGKIIGVANYYPQISLDREPEIVEAVRASLEMSQRIIDRMAEMSLTAGSKTMFPPLPKGDVPPQNFTLDFFLSQEAGILFLEGGPEGLRFAHPCSFLSNEHGVRGLAGVALGQDRDIVSIEDFLRAKT